ncbi:polysaccharide biosynthesis/export family protein [Vibrio sp. HN007]|uniref:polysaccharide biosynthesis/export family protein n=1 Tax=Vibrio iocasae TaxID=3098914 RepID=UPI0035D4396F
MKKILISILLTIGVLSTASAQATEQHSTTTGQQTQSASNPQNNKNTEEIKNTYHLSGGDIVRITVFGEPDLSMDVTLNSTGAISYPYIGNLQLKGRTPSEIEQEIEQKLDGDYLVNPMVTVAISNFRKFFILGEVSTPNGFEYQPGMNVQKAIAMAGGFTDRASRDINVQQSGSLEVIQDVELTFPINPGDTIIVEQSFF